MSTKEATPRPWCRRGAGPNSGREIWQGRPGEQLLPIAEAFSREMALARRDGVPVKVLPTMPESLATAGLIVRAVNSHAQLVDTARMAYALAGAVLNDPANIPVESLKDFQGQARAALALARGEEGGGA